MVDQQVQVIEAGARNIADYCHKQLKKSFPFFLFFR
jgi:hypothetical protein